jgi:hypothetical protein
MPDACASGGGVESFVQRSLDQDRGNQVGQQPAAGQPRVTGTQLSKPAQALQPLECQLDIP